MHLCPHYSGVIMGLGNKLSPGLSLTPSLPVLKIYLASLNIFNWQGCNVWEKNAHSGSLVCGVRAVVERKTKCKL